MGVLQLQQQNVAAAAAYAEYTVKIPPGVFQLTLVPRPGGSMGSFMEDALVAQLKRAEKKRGARVGSPSVPYSSSASTRPQPPIKMIGRNALHPLCDTVTPSHRHTCHTV
jgi:hypothetical protein